MGAANSAISKLSDPANALVYTEEAKRLDASQPHDDFNATKFLLNSHDTMNLQKYLVHGSSYPPTLDQAHASYRREKLVDLGYMSNDQYEVAPPIQQHRPECLQYSTAHHLYLRPAGEIGLYGKTAVRFFGFAHRTLSELQAQIDEASASGHPMTDDQIESAKKALQNVISELHTQTNTILNKCTVLKKEIMAFTNLTKTDSGNIATIVADCTSAGGTLGQRVADKTKDLAFWRDAKSTDEAAYEQDKIIAGTTATYALVFPPASTIAAAVVLGVYIARAVQAKDDMDAADRKILQDESDLNDALVISTMVAHYTAEWKNCQALADNAVAAVTKIELGFSDMLDNLHDLNDDAGLLDGVAHDPIEFALSDIAECSTVWGHIQTLASNYKEFCIIQVMNPDDSASFVKQVTEDTAKAAL
ncbi:hypothetical protein LTR17_023237 [Elasticomyces elasticus]|nr:hypothetical protein LTR17_023237 [Elasticomyces elasticus]